MPWMGEAAYVEPQMDDPGPGERKPRPRPAKVFRTLASLRQEALAYDRARTKVKEDATDVWHRSQRVKEDSRRN